MQRPVYTPGEEQALMTRLWGPQIKDDPEAFVLLAFPWGQANTPLERFDGPRKWQRRVLRMLRDHIAANRGQPGPPSREENRPCSKPIANTPPNAQPRASRRNR